jgi:hypothetical protein
MDQKEFMSNVSKLLWIMYADRNSENQLSASTLTKANVEWAANRGYNVKYPYEGEVVETPDDTPNGVTLNQKLGSITKQKILDNPKNLLDYLPSNDVDASTFENSSNFQTVKSVLDGIITDNASTITVDMVRENDWLAEYIKNKPNLTNIPNVSSSSVKTKELDGPANDFVYPVAFKDQGGEIWAIFDGRLAWVGKRENINEKFADDDSKYAVTFIDGDERTLRVDSYYDKMAWSGLS